MPNRETISLLASTGMLAPAMWLYDSYRAPPYTAQAHISFASAADVLRTKSTTRISTSNNGVPRTFVLAEARR